MLHYQTVSPGLTSLLKELFSFNELSSFVLVGGTSLSLQIGHRRSIDIDLFTEKAFDIKELQIFLSEHFQALTVSWQNKNGFTCIIGETKVDLFNWHTPFHFPVMETDGLRLASKLEIAAMKLETIAGRKEKKDFIDIAFLLKEFSLKELIVAFRERYPFLGHTMILESLMAVDLADESIDPDMIVDLDWADAKKLITESVENFFREQQLAIGAKKKNGYVKQKRY